MTYYDVQSDFLNPFKAEDYNLISETVQSTLMDKFKDSPISLNAENRLISELGRLFILTESLGWTLIYKSDVIESKEALNSLKL